MSEKSELWQRCQRQFKDQFATDEYDKWIKPLRADFHDDVMLISSTNGWAGRKVQDTYGDIIQQVIYSQAGDASIKIQFSNRRASAHEKPLRAGRRGQRPAETNVAELDKHFTFEHFVSGNSKAVEKAVAYDVADSFNDDLMVLVIYGDSGMGKTHLLHAIGHHIYDKFPDKAVELKHSTAFVNEVTSILKPSGPNGRNVNAAMQSLQDRYAQHDVILLDDLHRLVGKQKIQEEFLHLLTIWQKQRTKLAFTSLGPVSDLEQLDPALRSRLLGGISIHAMEPDEDTKVEILLQHAEREDANLPEDVAQYLAQRVGDDIRVMKGTLLSIVKAGKYAGRRHRAISRESIDSTLRLLTRAQTPVTADRVMALVSERFNVSVPDIKSSARVHSKLIPRQMGMLLTHELTSLPYTEIATAFGRKDHSTVKNALSAIEHKMKSDDQLRRDYDWLKHELKK